MANINDFKSRLQGGGARANQFKVTLPFPSYAGGTDETSDLSFLCTATGIPGQDIPMVTVNFRGRQLKLAGDSRTFADWSMTVLNDTDFKLYRAFERWMNEINNMTDNEGLTNPTDYQVDGFIDHLDRDGNSIKQYTIRGAFPTSLDGIALSYGTNDAIEDFGVTLAYQWFETDTTT
tara:strand:+ start:149 stop:679 length:531 start_codon:yes stop_codon:yes gene_type:complete